MSVAKICMIVHKDYFNDVRVRRYVESLIKNGLSVDVICLAENHRTTLEKQKQLNVYSIPVRHADRSRIGYVFEYLLAFVMFSVMVFILHIQNNYRVIHIHNMPDFLIFSGLMPKLMGARLILDIHDPMPEMLLSKYGEQKNTFLMKLIIFQEKISCWFADSIITVNSYLKNSLEKRGIPSSKISIVHNYPSSDVFNRTAYSGEYCANRDTFKLIYTGTLSPRYGLDIAIRALPELISKIPKIRLIIIGQLCRYRDELKLLAEHLGVSENVQINPLIPNKEIPRQLACADIGIYPARNDAHMNLATPTKILEYATMGIPIVSSRLKAIEELFDDSAVMFFDAGSSSQFAQCVIDLYQSPRLRTSFVCNADRLFTQKHSWEQEFQLYLGTLNHLLPEIQSQRQLDE